MRAYTFTNYYLSPMAKGIQSAHCLVDIGRKYKADQTRLDQYNDWADNHKTMVVLNGGNSKTLSLLIETLEQYHDMYPWGYFREDEDSLNGALTCVGIILPEKIYALAERVRSKSIFEWTDIEAFFSQADVDCTTTRQVVPKYGTPEFEPYEITKLDFDIVLAMNCCGLAI